MSLSDPPDPLDLLTDKQRAFVLAFVGAARGNGSEAARQAGYAAETASVEATRQLKKPRVQAALASARGRVSASGLAALKPFEPTTRTAIELATVKAIAARAEAERGLEAIQQRTLVLADREAVVDVLMKIALGQETETRTTKAGEPFEMRPPTTARVAAARALSAMEGWDAPTRVAGKVDHAHAHSGRVDVANGLGLPTAAELAGMTDAEIADKLALLERQTSPNPPALLEQVHN